MRVFFDTNVLLDVLLERKPFAAEAARLWSLAEDRKITGLISAVSFTNIFYIVRRVGSRADAETARQILSALFTPVACDGAILSQAMDAKLDDFEDAVQYFSAVASRSDVFVTRDAGPFPDEQVTVLTPSSFLAAHNFE